MNLSWQYTGQVRVLSRLTYFYRIFFSFPDFSLLSVKILTLNLVYAFLLKKHRPSTSSASLHLLLQELLSFPKISFFGFFFAVFWDIDLKCGTWIWHDIIQIKFKFRHAWPPLWGVNALCLYLISWTFSPSFKILTLNLVHEFFFMTKYRSSSSCVILTFFYRSYCPLPKI